jgi:hypothetical protein
MVGLPFMLAIIHSSGLVTLGLMIYTVSTGFWPLAPLLIIESVPMEIGRPKIILEKIFLIG